ncbi:hypothetical protein A2U01_0014670 [Trifolium medium]|uniref:Uncharacterized protein n=1 Tax=Trifolium medium TaxID=97028 RepID=A0A392N1N6_9FABA|nr:hypothetical protein [Trifolium medium]
MKKRKRVQRVTGAAEPADQGVVAVEVQPAEVNRYRGVGGSLRPKPIAHTPFVGGNEQKDKKTTKKTTKNATKKTTKKG